MKPFMGKAFTTITILSALLIAGFEGDRVNVLTILNHNVEFTKLCQASSDKVLNLTINEFSTYWWQHALIHEHIFDEAFRYDDDIDTNNNRTGKP